MKAIIIAFYLVTSIYNSKSDIVNSTWVFDITNKCHNTLKFKPHGIVLNYSCEMDYTCHGTYKFSKDTLIITTKDDSKCEDGGKMEYYKDKYFIKGDILVEAGASSHTYHGKWIMDKYKPDLTYQSGKYKKEDYFHRVK